MLLELKGISKGFYLPDGRVSRLVLDELDLSVEEQESVAIVGPSGSGKTTLLNLIAKLDQPDSGELKFESASLSSLTGRSLDTYRNQSIGIVFQMHHLMPQLNLLENVLLPALGKDQQKSLSRAEELLKRVGVWEQRFQKPGELSGGECQRVAVVRALINQPKLLLADEPTGALDQENANILSELLIDMQREQNTALILVTHAEQLAEKMNRQLFLTKGKLTEKQ